MRLGILGGTFDPVHYGHLRPAVEVCAALALDQVRLIPCRVSPHRSPPLAEASDRLEMLRLAVDTAQDLVVDERELARDGPSYTVDTLASLRAELPAARFYLIVGSDAFATFARWHRWREILAQANIVVTHRPGHDLQIPEPLQAAVADPAEASAPASAGRVYPQPVTQFDISATAIRALAARGGDLRYLLPPAVARLIQERNLYRQDGSATHAE